MAFAVRLLDKERTGDGFWRLFAVRLRDKDGTGVLLAFTLRLRGKDGNRGCFGRMRGEMRDRGLGLSEYER